VVPTSGCLQIRWLRQRSYPGRPRINPDLDDRIAGALANLGHHIPIRQLAMYCAVTELGPAPKRGQTSTWKDFIRTRMDVLVGTDFFTVEVLRWTGLVAYYILFFIHLESRRVTIAGITRHPTEEWMEQMARTATHETSGCLRQARYVLHDRDSKFCATFRVHLMSGGIEPVRLPAQSPNLNAFAEGWGEIRKAGMFVEADPVR
jgi:putative transposase